MKLLLELRYFIGPYYRDFVKWIVGVIPKDKKLILFSAWFGLKYTDNSKYMFEFLLKKNKYNLFWYTKSKDLYYELKKKNIPVVYEKSWKGIWYQCRAIMMFATVQTSDFNGRLLNKCYYIDLGHGFPGKPVGLAQPQVDEQWAQLYKFKKKGIQFYEVAASYFAVKLLSPCYDVDYDHFIFCNKPRIDVFFDETLRSNVNANVESLKRNKRLISYLPTHRACGKKHIDAEVVLDLPFIQKFCEKTNSVFLIKKHFYHREESSLLEKYPNIFDLTKEDVDTEVLLSQTDVLITDFSSCFNDFLAVSRPIIFYAFDYDDYMSNERDYFWKYDKITAGYTAKSKEEFNRALEALSHDWTDSKHSEGRLDMKRVYFDDAVEMGSSREKLCNIIDQMIEGTYVPFDWSTKALPSSIL